MVPARGSWTEALRRAAGRRGLSKKKRRDTAGAVPVKTAEERRRILADILSRNRK
jgi:hypothetical protein